MSVTTTGHHPLATHPLHFQQLRTPPMSETYYHHNASVNAASKSSCARGLLGGAAVSLLTKNPFPFLLGLCQCFLRVSAQQKVGGEFQVKNSTSTPSMNADLTSLRNGNFIVAWGIEDQDGSDAGVFGQLFDENATKLGNEFRINNYTINDQDAPIVTSLPNGNFVVTWYSWAQDGDGIGLFGQLFDENATKVGNEFQVNTYTNNSQWFQSATSLPNGNFIITWQSDYLRMMNEEIRGQLFDDNATKIGNEFQVNTYTNNSQSDPAMTSLPNGNFIVTWQSNRQDGSLDGVYGQLFNGNATKIGSEFQINNYTTFAQGYPAVASFSNNNFVVTWESYGQDGSEDGIFGQLFDENGAKIGNEFQVNTYTGSYQSRPKVACFPNRNFVVIWRSSGQDSDGQGIYGQLFDKNATKLRNEFQIHTYDTTFQYHSSVVILSNGNFVVTWSNSDLSHVENAVYGQIFHNNFTQLSSSTTSSSSSSSTTSSSTFSTTSSIATFRTTSALITSRDPSSSKMTVQSTTRPVMSKHSKTTLPTNSEKNNRFSWIWFLLGGVGAFSCVGLIAYYIFKSRKKEQESEGMAFELKNQTGAETAESHYQRTPDCVHPESVHEGSEYGLTPDCVHPGSEQGGTEYAFTPDCVYPGSEHGETEYGFTPDF